MLSSVAVVALELGQLAGHTFESRFYYFEELLSKYHLPTLYFYHLDNIFLFVLQASKENVELEKMKSYTN